MKTYITTNQEPPWLRSYGPDHTQKAKAYDAVKKAGENGATRVDVANAVGIPKDRVSFLLSELRRAGYIAVKGAPVDVSMLSPEEAAIHALGVLESALVAKARKGITPEMEKSFVRYQKVKALALRGTTEGEVRAALRLSIIELVKLVF